MALWNGPNQHHKRLLPRDAMLARYMCLCVRYMAVLYQNYAICGGGTGRRIDILYVQFTQGREHFWVDGAAQCNVRIGLLSK